MRFDCYLLFMTVILQQINSPLIYLDKQAFTHCGGSQNDSKKTTYVCACTQACASLCARTLHIHALACVVQLITFDPCGTPALRLHSALGGQTRRQWFCCCCCGYRGAQFMTVLLQSRWSSLGFLQCSFGDAHLDRRVSRGQLRVEALRCRLPFPVRLPPQRK